MRHIYSCGFNHAAAEHLEIIWHDRTISYKKLNVSLQYQKVPEGGNLFNKG